MIRFLKSLYFDRKFFNISIVVIILLFTSVWINTFAIIGFIGMLGLIIFTFLDILLIYSTRNGIEAKRICPEKLSNGDLNPIGINIINNYSFKVSLEVIDEIPVQFQVRDFSKKFDLSGKTPYEFVYHIKPVKRGVYDFGFINVYASSKFGLIRKRYRLGQSIQLAVYPSFLKLNQYNLMAISSLNLFGSRQVKKIGHTFELEQIRNFVNGDDIRFINWKATARKNELMVNQFRDERSQNIYSVIDMGRTMRMPFGGMTLLDYAINASLAISSVALKKDDRPGIVCINKHLDKFIKSDKKPSQLSIISEALYSIDTNYYETNYPMLVNLAKNRITQRSLIMLYTNFETYSGMQRNLDYLKMLSKSHLLVVIFFKNTELNQVTEQKVKNSNDVYLKVIAENFMFEKRKIVKELNNHGILTIFVEPEDLSVAVIQKYIEIKKRNMI